MSDPRLLAFFVKIRKALNTGDVVLPGPGVRPVPVAADIPPEEKTSPYERKVLSSLGRFTLEFEYIGGDTGYHVVLLDRGDQVGTEDVPGVMCVPISDEALLENAELSAEDAEHVRSSVPSIVGWLGPLGWRITGDDDEPPVSP